MESRDATLRLAGDGFHDAIVEGAAKRLRPKFMTMATTFIGFMPIMWATGTGSDVWKRLAAPMVGGILTSFLLELIVYPPIYAVWKWRALVRADSIPGEEVPSRPFWSRNLDSADDLRKTS